MSKSSKPNSDKGFKPSSPPIKPNSPQKHGHQPSSPPQVPTPKPPAKPSK